MTMIRSLSERPPVMRETTGERITRLRLASDRSIRQLAADAGICHMAVFRAEHDYGIHLHVFVAIAEALDVSMDVLYRGEP